MEGETKLTSFYLVYMYLVKCPKFLAVMLKETSDASTNNLRCICKRNRYYEQDFKVFNIGDTSSFSL